MSRPEYLERILKILCDMWDSEKLLDFYQAEYDRGYKQGRADERNAILQAVKDIGQPKAEPEKKPLMLEAPKTELAEKLQEESPKDEAPEVPANPVNPTGELPTAAQKDVGGRPRLKNDRPEGIPTNCNMAIEAIRELGPLSAPQIREYIRKKWWPGIQKEWTSVLWNFAQEGKLGRDGINFVLPKPKPDPLAHVEITDEENRAVLPREPSRIPMPAVRPTGGPRPEPYRPTIPRQTMEQRNEVAAEKFEHGGASVMLLAREYMMAKKLLAVKGQHIDASFLASSIGLPRTSAAHHETTLRDLQANVNRKIFQLGLTIEYFKGFGFLLKESR